MNEINYFSEDTDFQIDNESLITSWIARTILAEEMKPGTINYIFCTDNYLHKINLEYLKHDTLTDIITFNYCTHNIVNGDIYISVERVKENAKKYKKEFTDELHRVLIHGVLHLTGYNDKSDKELEAMRTKEDFYLSLLPN